MRYFKKIYTAASLMLITSMGYAHGDCGEYSSCEEVCQQDSCGCGEFLFGAEFLYLRAFEGGLSSVCDGTQIIDSTEDGVVVSRLKGRNHDPDFKWNPGFRIGVGYEFGSNNCGVGVLWTHFNSHSGKGGKHSDNSFSSLNSSQSQSQSSFSGSDSFSSSSSSRSNNNRNRHSWKIDFDAVDAVLGCDCNCFSCIDLTPYVGVKYARIDQRLNTNFFSTQNDVVTTSYGRSKQDFWGVGPLVGLEGEGGIGCGFSIYGNLAVAFLYGTHHVDINQTDVFDTGININHMKIHRQACQTVLDAGIGIRWKTCICNDKFIVLQLGVEDHRYFNYNMFGNYGDLSFDGVSFGVGFIY